MNKTPGHARSTSASRPCLQAGAGTSAIWVTSSGSARETLPESESGASVAVLALLTAIPTNRLAAGALAKLLSRRRSCERIAEAIVRWARGVKGQPRTDLPDSPDASTGSGCRCALPQPLPATDQVSVRTARSNGARPSGPLCVRAACPARRPCGSADQPKPGPW